MSRLTFPLTFGMGSGGSSASGAFGVASIPGQTIDVAWYGDSRRAGFNSQTANAYDVRNWVNGVPSGSVAGGSNAYARGAALQFHYPAARTVASLGVSGDTLAQMITREGAGASATRKALDDGWSVGARVIFVTAGINSITSLVTGGYVQGTTDTIIAARRDLIQRMVNRGYLVIDCGEMGYDYVGDAGGYPQSRIDGIRQTIAAVNVDARAFAAASGGAVIFLDTFSLVAEANGQWKTGMCEDTANPGQRVHLSVLGAWTVAQAEAQLMASLFGAVPPNYCRYPTGLSDTGNLIPNADLSASTTGLGTGWNSSGGGTGFARTHAIITRQGKRWQTASATFGGANVGNFCQISAPLPIQNGGTVVVAASQRYGFEADVFVDDGNGGAPPDIGAGAANFLSRIRIYGAGGNVYYDAMVCSANSVGPGSSWQGKVIWQPITMFEASATLTASTAWQFNYPSPAGLPFRIGVSSPRMVRLS